MARLVIQDLDDAVARRFAARADREKKSSEELAREIITRYADAKRESLSNRLDEIRRSTGGKAPRDPVAIIRRDRDMDRDL